MNILLAGASGLIGQELVYGLSQAHSFTLLGRSKETLRNTFPEFSTVLTWEELDTTDPHQFDAVINLCGTSIAAARWSDKVKEDIISSRVDTTKKLVDWVLKHKAKPHIYCANAIGIYGLQENGCTVDLSEETIIDTKAPHDFLSEIGLRWQDALKEAEQAGLAVTTTRFGVVLKEGKGFLGKLYPSFICGLGSIIGDGTQYLSWVSSDDVVAAYRFLLDHPNMTGPVNITAPNPCMQKEFAQVYAKALHRPLFLKTPAVVMRLLFGEMGEFLINRGQRVVPKRLLEAGFVFQNPRIEDALPIKD